MKNNDALEGSTLEFFKDNVDSWGAKEWFDRLVKAVYNHDVYRVSGDDLQAETCVNVIISTAFRLVRDCEGDIRQALQQDGWLTLEEFESGDPKAGNVWVCYKGLIKKAYHHALTYYFDGSLTGCFQSECITHVMPIVSPQPPEVMK